MDQVRAIAKVIWDQRFWVLSVLGIIIAVVCWKMAASDLDAQFATRRGAIEKQFSDMNSLVSKPVHANPAVNAVAEEQVNLQTQFVNTVWQNLYQSQKESVLKWPKELGEEFLTYIEKLKFRDPIDSRMRSVYQNYIGKRFDGLLDIVKAQKIEGQSGVGGYGRGEYGGRGGGEYAAAPMASGADRDYLVQWLDQDKLRQKLAFATSKPTSLQIWITQEDLWVYETLLRVIADTNKARGATRPDNTAIRTIVSLEVGAGASVPSTSQVYMPRGMAADAGMPLGGSDYSRGGYGEGVGGAPGYEGDYGRGGYGREGPMEGDPAAQDAALLANRYLDDTGAPIADGTVGKEFRRLPIRMELQIDQRYIPRLLIECGNAPLPIEVTQLRINPHQSMAGIETQGGGGYAGAGSSLPSGVTLDSSDPMIGFLELRGVVFIYNEPTADDMPVDPALDGTMASTP